MNGSLSLIDDPMFDVDGTRKLLGGISKYTVHAYAGRGWGKGKLRLEKTKCGGRTMFRLSAIEEFLRECQNQMKAVGK